MAQELENFHERWRLSPFTCRIWFFLGGHKVITVHTQPHGNGTGHQYRRINTKDNADGQCQGEVMQGFPTKEQHGGHHELRATVRDDGAAERARNGVINDVRNRGPAHFAKVFTHSVKHHYRFVYGISQNGQHRSQYPTQHVQHDPG